MSDGPVLLSLSADLVAPSIEAATRAVMAACAGAPGLPRVAGWKAGAGVGGKAAPEDNRAVPEGSHAVTLAIPASTGRIQILREPTEAADFLLDATLAANSAAARKVLPGLVALVRALAADGTMIAAAVTRAAGGICLPVVPLAEDASHVVLVATGKVERDYDDTHAFGAAWDEVEQIGDLLLCTRALAATGNPDFLRHVLGRHMAMARAARPGLVTFVPPRFADGEFELLDTTEPTLRGVGYAPDSQVYEFAAHTPTGTEISCIDLLNANRIVTDGRIEGGGPVREVRAVFPDAQQAARGARLLQAAGLVVYWQDGAGLLQRVADAA